MPKKIILLALTCLIFVSLNLYAANISVMVIETGLNKESPVNRYSYMWENGLLDVYFENGHIVSNSPILKLNVKPANGFPEEVLRDYDEAKETGMDYFAIAIIEYPSPFKVSLRLFNTKSFDMLYELAFTDAPTLPEKDRYERIKKAIQESAGRIR